MKKQIIVGLMMILSIGVFAQEKTTTFKVKTNGLKSVIVNIESAIISVEGYDGDEVIIAGENIPQIPKEAAGLRPLSAAGSDNTGLGLASAVAGNSLVISTVIRPNDKDTKYRLKIPKSLSVSYKQGNGWCGCDTNEPIVIANIDGEVNIKTNDTPIELKNVTGPIIAKSNNGKIKVIFDEKISEKPSSFVTYDGDIDITVSDKAKVGFGINFNYGNRSNVFTDLELKAVLPTPKQVEERTARSTGTSWARAVNPVEVVEPVEATAIAKKPITAAKAAQNDPIKILEEQNRQHEKTMAEDAKAMAEHTKIMAMHEKAMTIDAKTMTGQTKTIENALGGFSSYEGINNSNATNYVLNEAKTQLSIRTGNGNIFLRKK
jgi:hypothetical protein